MNLSQVLLTALKDNGAREIFGLPGDFALAFFNVIEQSAILPLYTLSHEPSLGFAADAAARMNSGLGVAAVTYGVGAFNLVNSIAGAYAEKSPVVVISGAPGTTEGERGLLLHHQAKTLDSQMRVFLEITCAQTRLDDPARAPAEIARVLRAALDQSRPVYFELPRDLALAPCEPVGPLAASAVDDEAVAACAEDVLDRLSEAKAPVLMAGVEVRRYGLEDRVADLARVLGLPVVTSFMGRGLFAHKDVPFIGTYLGYAGEPEVTRAVEESDGLLLLGVILSDTNFGLSRRHIDLRHTIQIADREARLGHHSYTNIPLATLIDALLARAKPAKAKRERVEPSYDGGLEEDGEPIAPEDVARAVNDLFERNGAMPISCDVGDCLFTAMGIRPTELVAPGYYAGMGFGVPAGLGLVATTGRRPLILVGDGAFQMTGWELGNCRRYGWAPIVIVFNNASWEMLRAFEPEAAYNDLPEWNFARLAEAMGGVGRRVASRRELKAALDAAHADDGTFQLIDVVLARGKISPTLARFVAGIRRAQASSGGSAGRARMAESKKISLDEAFRLAVRHHEAGRLAEGISLYQKILEVSPNHQGTLTNLANIWLEQGRLDDAIAGYDRALAIEPDHALTHLNKSLALLTAGRYGEGWSEYEWRWKCREFPTKLPDLAKPAWDGAVLDGKTILLYPEQGLGDAIHFARYAPLVAARGGRVLLRSFPTLAGLMKLLDGVADIVAVGDPLPDFDCHAALMTLPRIFATTFETIPADVPYLRAEPERVARWAKRLEGYAGLKVGLVWAGSVRHMGDRNRSIALEVLAPLFDLAGVSFFSLQFGAADDEVARADAGAITDLGPEIKPLSEMAAALETLDLLITVDTAAAHLAGALARPCWLLLSHFPDWRWLLDREDSLWYPTLRLFRQAERGQWGPVIARLREELGALASSGAAR